MSFDFATPPPQKKKKKNFQRIVWVSVPLIFVRVCHLGIHIKFFSSEDMFGGSKNIVIHLLEVTHDDKGVFTVYPKDSEA